MVISGLDRMGSMKRKARIRTTKTRDSLVGWREHVGLPELGIPIIRAKIDTGARTSALHAESIRAVEGSEPHVVFAVPYTHDGKHLVECVAPLVGKRAIKNTSGLPEERFIINTVLVVGNRRWHIEISLANRMNMGFDLILGRTALRGHRFSVTPARSYLAGEPVYGKTNAHEVPK